MMPIMALHDLADREKPTVECSGFDDQPLGLGCENPKRRNLEGCQPMGSPVSRYGYDGSRRPKQRDKWLRDEAKQKIVPG